MARMEEVKITQLRQNLPEYLAKVRRGGRIRVTSRGKAIAEIAPPNPSTDDAQAARRRLHGSLLKYELPTEPVIDPGDWEANR
jgi:prevent-host-death family protein